MKIRFAAAAAIATAFVPIAAQAAPALHVRDGWSRPAAAGGTAVGYLTLVNKGPADALVAAESPVAQKVEMHASSMAGGVMRMSRELRVDIPAGGQVSFAPGGRHLMLIGLKKAFRQGDRAPLTLRFASGARLTTELAVSPTAPTGGAATTHMDHMAH
jgi:copper(I)-binding protein